MSVTPAPDPTGLRPARTGRRPRDGAWPSRAAGLLFSVLLTFFGLLAITFIIGRVVPIDPVLAIVGDRALPQVYARVRQELALDEPIYVQFWIYLSHVLRGDFGTSVLTSRPVLEDILHFFPATIELTPSVRRERSLRSASSSGSASTNSVPPSKRPGKLRIR